MLLDTSAVLRHLIETERLGIAGAYYELATGRVHFSEPVRVPPRVTKPGGPRGTSHEQGDSTRGGVASLSAPAAQSGVPAIAPATAVHVPAPVVQSPPPAPATSKSQTGAVTPASPAAKPQSGAAVTPQQPATSKPQSGAVAQSSPARRQAAAGHADCEIALSRSMRTLIVAVILAVAYASSVNGQEHAPASATPAPATAKPATAKPPSNGQAACRRVAHTIPRHDRRHRRARTTKARRRKPRGGGRLYAGSSIVSSDADLAAVDCVAVELVGGTAAEAFEDR